MTDSVREYDKTCLSCIKRKSHLQERAPLVNVKTTHPLELLCVDLLSLEPCKGGIENILVITDHFTRYVHTMLTKNQAAKTTALVLYASFLQYGFPRKLHSDQGRNFESSVIKELSSLVGVQKSRTTPYHPMANGMCERFNHTLLDMSGTLEDKQKEDWKQVDPTLVHAYNATKHDSTGHAPFYLKFGRHSRLPVDLVMCTEFEERDSVSTPQYIEELKAKLAVAYDIASSESEAAATDRKKRYDRRVRGATVEVGDRALVKNVRFRGNTIWQINLMKKYTLSWINLTQIFQYM